MKRVAVVAALASSMAIAAGTMPSLSARAEGGPVKVVVLVVDGLHPSEVNPVDAPNIASLREAGTWYEESRSIFVAETIPNHVAMMTGAYGQRSGIPVNKWWSRDPEDEPGSDMDDPALLKAETLFTTIDKNCPDLRTAAVLSKTYLHGIFSGDRDGDGAPDADYLWDPQPVVPGSGHAPDPFTTDIVLDEIPNRPDLLFVNLGDVDRSGHVDPSGIQDPAFRAAILHDTDVQVGRIVDALKASGDWEKTVMVLTSDHSMDWSTPGDYISLDEVFSGDDRTAGKYEVIQNGGVDNVYLKPDVENRRSVLKTMYELATGTDGVAGVYYRRPNPEHMKGAVAPRAWGLRTKRVGDLIAMAAPGRRFSDPSSTDNPIPGNHGHAVTRHNVMLVSGGSPLVLPKTVAASDPDKVDPLNDTRALPEQSETVDIGVTIAWLLGLEDPGVHRPQFQGRVLDEAFTSRPEPACT
ncbi:MAG: alkaline phosphatase family protein [Actinomycetota bacterium]